MLEFEDDPCTDGNQGGGRTGLNSRVILANTANNKSFIQVAWYLSQIRPCWQPSSLNYEWWVGLTDAAKTGEFKWRLGEDVKASTATTTTTTTTTTMMPAAVLTEQAATTMPWPSVDIGPGDAYCGTLDANTTLRGVDCAVGKTDTVVRTILCEAGEDSRVKIK